MNRFKRILASLFFANPKFWVALLYGDIWRLRKICLAHNGKGFRRWLYKKYFEQYGAFIGLGASFTNIPTFPHGYFGVFISNSARIGKNAVIFQHVCIGSNTLSDSNGFGAPTIGDNVYIGAGAAIIGNVFVGDNARIGANCVVVKNAPPNSVTVIKGVESLQKQTLLDNSFNNNSFSDRNK